MSSLFLLAQDNYHKYIASLLVGITALAAGLYLSGVRSQTGIGAGKGRLGYGGEIVAW